MKINLFHNSAVVGSPGVVSQKPTGSCRLMGVCIKQLTGPNEIVFVLWIFNCSKLQLIQGLISIMQSDSSKVTLPAKDCIVKVMLFPVVMYQCESWTIKKAGAPKNSCFQTVVLEKTLESHLDSKEIKSANLKGNQPWIFMGRTNTEAEAPKFSTWWEVWIHWKRPWCWERLRAGAKGVTVNEMVGWHHWLSGHEFKRTQGDSGGQRSLMCCSPWGHKESDIT